MTDAVEHDLDDGALAGRIVAGFVLGGGCEAGHGARLVLGIARELEAPNRPDRIA